MATPEVQIYIIRHAESMQNASPENIGGRGDETPLSLRGEDQAAHLGACLLAADMNFDELYRSPAVRTAETGRIALLGAGIELPMTIVEDLHELDQGDWAGQPRAVIYTPEVLADIERLGKDFKAPNGESSNDVGHRMLAAVLAIAREKRSPKPDGQPYRIGILGHGIAIKCLAAELEGWDQPQIYHTKIDNVTLSRFDYRYNQLCLVDLGRSPDEL